MRACGWTDDSFWRSQIVLAAGLSMAFVGVVGSAVRQVAETGALASPLNTLTFSAFLHGIRLFGGEIGAAVVQRVVSVREQFHSNVLGLGIESGDWLTDERLRALAG